MVSLNDTMSVRSISDLEGVSVVSQVSVELSRHERRKQRTRQQLKQATVTLLIEKGYEALKIQDITDHLDLARATFYVHFRDKDEVIWEVMQDSFEELYQTLSRELAVEPSQRHSQKLLLIFQYAEKNRALLSVMLGEKGHITLLRKLANYMALIIQRDIESGLTVIPPDVPAVFASQFLSGAMMQVIMGWFEHSIDQTPEELTRLFSTMEATSRS